MSGRRAGRLQWLVRTRRQEGQSLIIVAIVMLALLGIVALVIDVGDAYLAKQHMQKSADAAALAAAAELPGNASPACTYSASAVGTACLDSSPGAGLNFSSSYPNVQTSYVLECLSSASAGTGCKTGTACPAGEQYPPEGPLKGISGCNAIAVTQTTTVNPFFGFGETTVSATATAAIAGGVPHPLDVEVVDDATPAMGSPDTCGGTPTDVPSGVPLTREDCAKAGIRSLLTQLPACYPNNPTCADDGAIPDQTGATGGPLDEVGLVTYPAVTSARNPDGSVIADLNCAKDLPGSDETYTPGTSYGNFQIVPFSSDFRLSDAPTSPDPLATLNPFSNLVRSVFWPGDGCPDGGYPINTGGPATSISGGQSTSATNNTSAAIGVGGDATTSEGGITPGSSQTAVNTSSVGVTRGGSTTAVTGIGGGPNSGDPRDTATTTRSSSNSVTLNEPANADNGDFLLATLTAQSNNVTQTSLVCAPGGWTLVDQQRVSGTLLQATFSTTLAASTSFTFNFRNNSCGGSSLTVSSSAVVLRYTNVSGVDVADGLPGPTATSYAGSAPANSVWTSGTSTLTNTYNPSSKPTWRGTEYASFTSGTGQCGTSAACDTTLVGSGLSITNPSFTFTSNTGRRTTYTVQLLIGDSAPTGTSHCTVAASSESCAITGTWAVPSASTISLSVTKGGSGGNLTAGYTASVGVTGGADTNYVSLASSCVGGSVTSCDDATVPAAGGSITTAGLTFGNNVPSGDTFTVTLLQGDTTTGSTCTIAAGQRTCTVSGTPVTATPNASLELQVTRTAGTTAFSTNATTTTAATVVIGGTTVTAPAVTTTQPNDQVVGLYGTAANGFAAGNAPPLAVSGSSTATGADDATQANAGDTGAKSVMSSSPDSGVGQTVALTSTSSITIQTPSDYVANSGFVLVTIAASNLGSGSICAANDWTSVMAATKVGNSPSQVTQQSFYTSTAAPGSYTFGFRSSCSGGSAVPAGATAVAVNYTGVDLATPFDNVTPQPNSGSSVTLAPLQVTTNSVDDTVVSLVATDAATLGLPNTGVSQLSRWTSTGITDQQKSQPGAITPDTASSSPNAANWTTETVALKAALPQSITIPAVQGYSPTDGNNDLLLVSITARGLGSAVICAPPDTGNPATSWTRLGTTTSGSGASQITQTAFWTTSSTTYDFTFNSNANCTGNNLVGAGASAVAMNYAGVEPTPVLACVTKTGQPSCTATPNEGTQSSTLTAPDVTTTNAYSEVVSTFGTLGSWSSGTHPAVQNPNSLWVDGGADSTLQPAAGDQTSPQQETTTSPANWTGITVALSPLLNSSITVTPPGGYVGGGADLMIVNLAARNLGSGSICAPDTTWKPVPLSLSRPVVFTKTSGSVTQEAFYTSTSDAATDTFSFFSQPNCNGAPLGLAASAATVYYTGVDTAAPLDVTPAGASGSSNAPTPAPITTQSAGDEIVTLFGSGGTNLGTTISQPGNGAPAVGVNNVNTGSPPPPPPAWSNPGLNTPPATTSDNANWTAETVALQPLLQNGIVVQRPQTNAAPNDFILVTVTAGGLPSTDNICAPDDGTWTELGGAMVTSGTTDQATWYSFRPGADDESYTFTFQPSCSTPGASLSAHASAVAVRFAGVNPITPVDVDNAGMPIYSPQSGTGTTLSPAPVTPFHTGDYVLTVYGTGTTSLSISGCTVGSPAGTSTSTGFCIETDPGTTEYTPPAGQTTTSAPWQTQTIALEASSSSCSDCVYGVEAPTDVSSNCGDCPNYVNYAYGIQAATAQLQALQSTRPGAQNVIIVLSDGDAAYRNQDGSYPCNAGVSAAEAAEAPTSLDAEFFSIAWGASSSTSSSCSIDNSGDAPIQPISALCAMKLMADNSVDDLATYANDQAAYTSLCTDGDNPANGRFFSTGLDTSLEGIFQEIASSFVTPRLIANNSN